MHLIIVPSIIILLGIQPLSYADASFNHRQERIHAIEQEIARLQEELELDEQSEFEIVSKGQRYMVADWSQYGEDIQEARKRDLEGKAIQERIRWLKKEKEKLLHPSSAL